MRSTALPYRRTGLALLALAAALGFWLVLATPKAEAATVRLDGARTTLTTYPTTTTVLFGAGIIPLPVAPTPVVPTPHAARYTFPITGGYVDAKTLVGKINHSGGILLAQRVAADDSWKALKLTKFAINVRSNPANSFLSAVVNGGARLPIAKLDLSKAKIDRFMRNGHAFVRISNVAVTLNATATGAINSTFGVALPAEVPLGTASVLARVAH
jgi:hypothetical protein